MNISLLGNSAVTVYTPDEVLAYRSCLTSGKKVEFISEPLSEEVRIAIGRIVRIHGSVYFNHALYLAHSTTNELVNSYDYKFGHRVTISRSYIPEFLLLNEDASGISRFLEYTALIISAFGWIATLTENDDWHYFTFAPMQALTPEQVDIEIAQKIDKWAFLALGVITRGILEHTHIFYISDLGLPQGMQNEDFELLIKRLRELLPGWNVRPTRFGMGFKIIRSTP